MAFFLSLFSALLQGALRAFAPAVLEKMDDTAELAQPQPDLRNRLRARIVQRWGSGAVAIVLCCGCALLGGCFTRTIYVPAGEPVMLRETIKGAKIWAPDAQGKRRPGTMDLVEGWHVLELNPTAKQPTVVPQAPVATTTKKGEWDALEENPFPDEKVPFSEVR